MASDYIGYIVRHAPTATSIISEDCPLIADAAYPYQLIRNINTLNQFRTIFSSPTKRTLQTIQNFALAPQRLITSDLLRPMDWGDFKNKPLSFVKAEMDICLESWTRGNLDYHAPNGESLSDLCQRMELFVSRELDNHRTPALICTHSSNIRAVLQIAHGLVLSEHQARRQSIIYRLEKDANRKLLITATNSDGKS